MILANVGLAAFTAHAAIKVPSYVRWRRVVVIPASLLSTIGTATTFRGTMRVMHDQIHQSALSSVSVRTFK